MLIDNKKEISLINQKLELAKDIMNNPVISNAFYQDFTRRFCWSNNALEGNTLSLEETVKLIDYDEVRSGHKYSEYLEAKNVHQAIMKMIIPVQKKEIDEEWIQRTNGYIMGNQGQYRNEAVYVGSVVEAIYYPPAYEKVPELMKEYIKGINFIGKDIEDIFSKIAEQHIRFERIHPFLDGNGRTGRILINQQLINQGLVPLSINPTGKYRQSFRRYEQHGDISVLTHILLKSEIDSFDRIFDLNTNYQINHDGNNIEKTMKRNSKRKRNREIDY